MPSAPPPRREAARRCSAAEVALAFWRSVAGGWETGGEGGARGLRSGESQAPGPEHLPRHPGRGAFWTPSLEAGRTRPRFSPSRNTTETGVGGWREDRLAAETKAVERVGWMGVAHPAAAPAPVRRDYALRGPVNRSNDQCPLRWWRRGSDRRDPTERTITGFGLMVSVKDTVGS